MLIIVDVCSATNILRKTKTPLTRIRFDGARLNNISTSQQGFNDPIDRTVFIYLVMMKMYTMTNVYI